MIEIKALDGAVAAAQSAVSMEYARQILINNGDEDAAAWTVGIEALDDARCDANVASDGFDALAFTCARALNVFNITATDGTASASGTVTRPTPL